ncbi:unnamed protein product [Allacma fusca]|uniref:C2H2-type domain-containing protein n=1 Tax=Allacma fusca TaxID=39272 RepID=A0A8J2KET1_9HEXA|nr:unnamed protein product [Allacma fusca]
MFFKILSRNSRCQEGSDHWVLEIQTMISSKRKQFAKEAPASTVNNGANYCLVCHHAVPVVTPGTSTNEVTNLLKQLYDTLELSAVFSLRLNDGVGNGEFCGNCSNALIESCKLRAQIERLKRDLQEIKLQLKMCITSTYYNDEIENNVNQGNSDKIEELRARLVRKTLVQCMTRCHVKLVSLSLADLKNSGYFPEAEMDDCQENDTWESSAAAFADLIEFDLDSSEINTVETNTPSTNLTLEENRQNSTKRHLRVTSGNCIGVKRKLESRSSRQSNKYFHFPCKHCNHKFESGLELKQHFQECHSGSFEQIDERVVSKNEAIEATALEIKSSIELNYDVKNHNEGLTNLLTGPDAPIRNSSCNEFKNLTTKRDISAELPSTVSVPGETNSNFLLSEAIDSLQEQPDKSDLRHLYFDESKKATKFLLGSKLNRHIRTFHPNFLDEAERFASGTDNTDGPADTTCTNETPKKGISDIPKSKPLKQRKPELFKCLECDKSYQTKEYYIAHQYHHRGIYPFHLPLLFPPQIWVPKSEYKMSLESLLHILGMPSEEEADHPEPRSQETNDLMCETVPSIVDKEAVIKSACRMRNQNSHKLGPRRNSTLMPTFKERKLSVGNSEFCEDCASTIVVSRNVLNQMKLLEANLDQLRDQLKKNVTHSFRLTTPTRDPFDKVSDAGTLARKLFAQCMDERSNRNALPGTCESISEKGCSDNEESSAETTGRSLRKKRQAVGVSDLVAESMLGDEEESQDEEDSLEDGVFSDQDEYLESSDEGQAESDSSEEFVMKKRKRQNKSEHGMKEKWKYGPEKSDSEVSSKKRAAKKPFVCNECGKGYLTRDIYEAHLKTHSGELEYACQHCDKKFAVLKYLQLHNRTAHNITNKLQSESTNCPFCGLDFIQWVKSTSTEEGDRDNDHYELEDEAQREKSYSSLKKEFSTVDQSTSSTTSSTSSAQNLLQHPNFLTWSEEKKRRNHMNSCPENPRVKYKDHKSTATRIPCNQCDKTFCTISGLNSHITNIHLKRFKLYCEICGAGFQLPCDLKRHLDGVHTDEKKFECDICHLRFKRSHQLLYHRRNHTGEFPFVCEVCGKAFTAPEKLKRHSVVHAQVNRFPCHICGKLFKSSHYVYNHIYTTHYGNKRVRPPKSFSGLPSRSNTISSNSGHLSINFQPTYLLHDKDVYFDLKPDQN